MIQIKDLTFTYPGSQNPALQIQSLHIPPGSFTLITGRSGSGKSTFLRLTNALVPYFSGGTITGSILVNGKNPLLVGPQVMSRHVGFVFQEPENQFVVNIVEDEIAFSMENAAIPRSEMQTRIQTILEQLNIQHLRFRKVDSLSGGETQRVAIAAALVLIPELLVLDEPTSQLDPQAAQEVLTLLDQLRKERSITILIAEHRLERVLPYCDHMLNLGAGNKAGVYGTPAQVIVHNELQPPIVQLAQHFNWQPIPLGIEEARSFAEKVSRPISIPKSYPQSNPPPILSMREVSITYPNQPVLSQVNLDLFPGERLVIMGPNGAGKSTLLRGLIGLIKPSQGEILINGQSISDRSSADICQTIGFLPQDPNALLFAETVTQELEITLKNHNLPINPKAIHDLLDSLFLKEEGLSYPRDLSTGERQRVALGAITITNPPILILDEPTRGLDQIVKHALCELLINWNENGKSILLVTHDVEFAAMFASRVIILEQGKIIANGNPGQVMHEFSRYRTQIANLFPETNWLTVEDVLINH
ncbi:MAG: ABC transporter ATP-binding protein [Anaerolineaceae bacterium]